MSLATASAIRDRIYTLLESLAPTSLAGDKFRRFRNEDGADFDEWAEKNPAGALRRFQVRQALTEDLPQTTSGTEERVRARFILRMAYPQNHRYGRENAMDRDDVINEDWLQINETVGIYGAANFTGAYDCILLGATPDRESGGRIDFLVVTVEVEFVRSVA